MKGSETHLNHLNSSITIHLGMYKTKKCEFQYFSDLLYPYSLEANFQKNVQNISQQVLKLHNNISRELLKIYIFFNI